MITDSITISVHDNYEWSIASYRGGEQEMSVGGPLTDAQVIALFKEWVIDEAPSPKRIIEILDSFDHRAKEKVRVR